MSLAPAPPFNAIREMENHGCGRRCSRCSKATPNARRASSPPVGRGSHDRAGRPRYPGPAARAAVRPGRHSRRLGVSARDRLAGGAGHVRHRAVGMADPPPDRHERRLFIDALSRETGVRLDEELSQRLRELHAQAYLRRRETVVPLPGARELLAHLHERQVPFAIATSGARHTAGSALALLGLPDDVPVVTRDLVARASPTRTCSSLRPAALGRPGALLRGGRQRLGPARRTAGRCPGHRTALGWLRPRGARALRRLPRLRRPGRDADPAGGSRRSTYPLTVGSDRGGCVAGTTVSITIVCARVVGKRKRSTAAAWRYG